MGRLRWGGVAAASVLAVTAPHGQGDIRLHVEAPTRVVSGETAAIVLRLRNGGTRTQTLYLRGRDVVYDLLITDSANTVTWRRLEGEVIPAIVQVHTLAVGEELVVTTQWPHRTRTGAAFPPGRYTLRVTVLTDGEPFASPPVMIEVARPG